jgi:CheY-like chemotaxis protein
LSARPPRLLLVMDGPDASALARALRERTGRDVTIAHHSRTALTLLDALGDHLGALIVDTRTSALDAATLLDRPTGQRLCALAVTDGRRSPTEVPWEDARETSRALAARLRALLFEPTLEAGEPTVSHPLPPLAAGDLARQHPLLGPAGAPFGAPRPLVPRGLIPRRGPTRWR